MRLTPDLRFVAVNNALAQLVERDPGELAGELLDVVLSGSARILFQTHVYPALSANGRVEEVFLTLVTRSGETLPVLFNATRSSVDGQVGYDALVVRIPARARWEQELLATTRELERERAAGAKLTAELSAAAEDLAARYAEEQRTRAFREALIGVVSHELRTPITTILGMSHLLRKRALRTGDDALAADFAELELEAERMRRLTENLLVMSRAEAGRLEIEPEPLRIEPLIRRAVATEQAQAPRHAFVIEPVGRLPLVMGDEVSAEQVIGNFASNAAKYSPPGTRIHVPIVEEADGVSVRVIDEGPGLGDQDPEQLFELFYRSVDARRRASGAGIGLYVCRALVEAMGGRVWARPSDRPPGAEFGFWLPAVTE
jgi:signal transduction histidine kinase